jgi:hypothetical protein
MNAPELTQALLTDPRPILRELDDVTWSRLMRLLAPSMIPRFRDQFVSAVLERAQRCFVQDPGKEVGQIMAELIATSGIDLVVRKTNADIR